MANVLVQEYSLQSIADAIRSKNGTQNTYKPSQMADAIESIPSGGITPSGTKSITENGTYDVTDYANAQVAVPTGSTPVINPLSVTENGTYNAPTGVDGYSPVTVNVPSSGTTLSAMAYPVVIQSTRSSSVAINRAVYKSATTIGFARSNVTSSSPLTINDMLTDGTHVFFNASAGSSITYNGNPATFVKDGTDFMLTIPDGFDGTIPFVLA